MVVVQQSLVAQAQPEAEPVGVITVDDNPVREGDSFGIFSACLVNA